jgi:uncharacterized membrane protein
MVALCPEIIRDRCENEAILQLGVSITSFFFTMTIVVPSVLSGHSTFTIDKLMYYREASTGVNKFSYFIGKNLADATISAWNALITTGLYLIFASPPGSYAKWYGTVYFLNFAGLFWEIFICNNLQVTAWVTFLVTLWKLRKALSSDL